MNPYEKAYKIVLECLILLICYFGLNTLFLRNWTTFPTVLFSIVIAHTVTWFLNGQAMTMLIHMNLIPNDPSRFILHTDLLVNNIGTKNYILGAAVFGGLTRGEFRRSSDLDVRLIMKEGFMCGVRTSHFCFLERVRALFHAYPLDLFAFNFEEAQKKMEVSETPIILFDPADRLRSSYPKVKEYEKFRAGFCLKYVSKQAARGA